MNKDSASGLSRILRAIGHSRRGFAAAFRHEAAFRQELALVAVAVILATLIADSLLIWLLLVGSGLLVLIVELLNSAIEAVVDRFGGDWHELSGRAKDMGSAAVMVSLALMGLTWLIVLWDTRFQAFLS